MKRPIPAVLAAILPLIWSPPALPHAGKLDPDGCHGNRRTNDYHCHRTVTEAGEPDLVRKARNGVCHDPTSPNYHDLGSYRPYDSMRACLASGGRKWR